MPKPGSYTRRSHRGKFAHKQPDDGERVEDLISQIVKEREEKEAAAAAGGKESKEDGTPGAEKPAEPESSRPMPPRSKGWERGA